MKSGHKKEKKTNLENEVVNLEAELGENSCKETYIELGTTEKNVWMTGIIIGLDHSSMKIREKEASLKLMLRIETRRWLKRNNGKPIIKSQINFFMQSCIVDGHTKLKRNVQTI